MILFDRAIQSIAFTKYEHRVICQEALISILLLVFTTISSFLVNLLFPALSSILNPQFLTSDLYCLVLIIASLSLAL